jgi:acyl-CoA synthetase (AMP-forming)/AMP-acid ligase II
MRQVSRPNDKYRLMLRCIFVTAGSPSAALAQWLEEELRVAFNVGFGQTEANTVIGTSTELEPRHPGALGKAYPGHDVAILDAQTIDFVVAKKEPFVLSISDRITQPFLEQELGVLCFIWGALGSSVEVVPRSQGAYVEVPIYSNGGYLKTVTQMTITGEFKEEQVQVFNKTLFPQLSNTTISGASRDLSGMSGSGLWFGGEARTYSLVGILKGSASGNIADPEIRFAPIWTVRTILGQMSNSDDASVESRD